MSSPLNVSWGDRLFTDRFPTARILQGIKVDDGKREDGVKISLSPMGSDVLLTKTLPVVLAWTSSSVMRAI